MAWKAVPREREEVTETAKLEELPYPDHLTRKGPKPSVGHEVDPDAKPKRSGKG